jgi:hypothetical protein
MVSLLNQTPILIKRDDALRFGSLNLVEVKKSGRNRRRLTTLVLVAEKTGYRQILTIDSDFLFYRITNKESFDIIQVY